MSEQDRILSSKVTEDGGFAISDPVDKIFLLTESEVESFFSHPCERICFPTDYAVDQGVDKFYSGRCNWWLRSVESFGSNLLSETVQAKCVWFDGYVGSERVDSTTFGVRPAMIIKP